MADGTWIVDLFAAYGPVRLRRMFGGRGIYAGDLIIGIEVRGTIFLKADEATRPRFEAAGSRPFTYEKNGRPYALSYWSLPDEAADDPEALAAWARLAEAASRRTPRPAAKRRVAA